jgi:hypothetical protein
MKILPKTVSALLPLIFMLVSDFGCRTPLPNAASNMTSPVPINFNVSDRIAGDSLSVNSVSTTPNKRQTAKTNRIDQGINKAWRKLFRSTKLNNLNDRKLAANDIEIRVWDLSDLFIPKTKCWVFSRENGEWKAFMFIDPEFTGKIKKERLDKPLLGWDSWDSYANAELNAAKIREVPPETELESDAITLIIEVKFGDDYAKTLVDNRDFMTILFKTIKSEFFNDDEVKWSNI